MSRASFFVGLVLFDFDLSAPAVTLIATTNLQLAAGAVLKVCVVPEGCDLIDVRSGRM